MQPAPRGRQLVPPPTVKAADKLSATVVSEEINRGRLEKRTLRITGTNPERLDWESANSVAEITREVTHLSGRKAGQSSKEVTYYVSNRHYDPAEPKSQLQVMADIRLYWEIEGGLHQSLDVGAKEDGSRVRNRNALKVLGMLRRSIHGLFTDWRESAKKKRNNGLRDFHDKMGKNNQLEAYRKIC